MPCFHPLEGFTRIGGGLTFKRRESNGNKLKVACGQCLGCRIDRSRSWAIRCVHEASLHCENMFLTLTYAPEHLPRSGSLQHAHFQKFMKRYRKLVYPQKLRYFMCGEYGEKLSRPHYHCLVFGHRFGDLLPFSPHTFRSETLETLWPFGFSTIGDVTFQSAAYVARYVTKKITGDGAKNHYEIMVPSTGEIHSVKPEYVTMSRRPGVAKQWFEKYHWDIYNHDYVVYEGKKLRSPRYYDKLFEEKYPIKFDELKHQRKENAKQHADNNTPERLAVRKEVLKAKIQKLKRSYENET